MERLHRQQRIAGWDQSRLDNALVALVGDSIIVDMLALSAAALGIGRLRVIRPSHPQASQKLMRVARRLAPTTEWIELDGLLVNKVQQYYFEGAQAIVDVSSHRIGKMLVSEWLFSQNTTGVLTLPVKGG